MMTAEILSYLRRLEIKVSVDGTRLRLSAPAGALTPEIRLLLAERKSEIISFIRDAQLAVSYDPLPLQPVPRDRNFPLSFAQQWLWFLDQLDPASPAYNISSIFRLQGDLIIPVLQQSLDELVKRQEILRTSFEVVEGEPYQRVSAMVDVPLKLVDLTQQPQTERQQRALRAAADEARTPFDLSSGPLIRLTLFKLDVAEHLLVITIHHIISDGWSIRLLIREIAQFYQAFSAGCRPSLSAISIHYADFAYWQRQWLRGSALDEQLGFWKQKLSGLPRLLQLPTDKPRLAVVSMEGASVPLKIDQTLSDAVRRLSLTEGVTVFMTLLAAFQTLLCRYTGQADLVIGTSVAGRNRREIEAVIGFFVNMLPLRADLSGNPTTRELLKRVREVTIEVHAHQDLPFEKLVDELKIERHLSYTPIFQAVFTFQNSSRTSLQLPGLTITPIELPPVWARPYDLTLSLSEKGQELNGVLQYNASLFYERTIRAMLDHYLTLLKEMTRNPDAPILEIPLDGKEEAEDLVSMAGISFALDEFSF